MHHVIQQHPGQQGQQGQSVSGLLIAMTAYTDSVRDIRQQHDIVDLMIDSGAATHVCPQWFAPKFQLHALPKGDEPQLRTVTNTQIKVHGYKYVIMKNNKGQPIVIPFYVCDVHAPILSVTRLTEQGFNIQLNETPTITHKHGFETQLVQKDGLYFMRAEMTELPHGTTFTVKHTEQGQVGMIAPTMTLTPTGPATQAGGGNADYWYWNEQGYLVRHHTQHMRSLFVPRDNCPIPQEDIGNYRKTIVKYADKPDEQHIEEAWQSLNHKQQKRMLPGNIWRGETWVKTTPGARDRYNERVLKARQEQASQPEHSKGASKGKKQTTTSLRAEQQLAEAPRGDTRPTRRLTEKTTEHEVFRQADTSIPGPQALQPSSDYWIREGLYWKRVHIKPRTALHKPEQTEDGPDISTLTPYRSTLARPTTGERFNRLDDEWTGEHKELPVTWTGSTNFEEKEQYKAQLDNSEDEHRPQQALRAKGVQAPQQPTPQERAEHELTHLPYRSWYTICVQSKGRQDHHKAQQSRHPVIQCDFAYIKGIQDKTVVPIFTAIDVQTGMGMAVYVHDKTQQVQYLQRCLQSFLWDCGRNTAILNSTVLQSDQEDLLITILKATALAFGGNMQVRQKPAYSSQSQGSVERYHATLAAQIRTLRAQVEKNYNVIIGARHPITPWIVRHAARLLNRYAVHSDSMTSYSRRWHKEHRTPLCEFGETVQYMIQDVRLQGKLEQRFFTGIWLGKDTHTNESVLGIPGKIIKARTVRRQIAPEKYNKQLLDTINVYPWNPTKGTVAAPTFMPLPSTPGTTSAQAAERSTQTIEAEEALDAPTPHAPQSLSIPTTIRQAITDLPLATSPTSYHSRQALPTPEKRSQDDTIAEGSTAKQARTATETTRERPGTEEPSPTRRRVNNITVKTAKGGTITTASSEDTAEQDNINKILKDPIIYDNEGFDEDKLKAGMNKEIESMKKHQVFTEIHLNDIPLEDRKNLIQSRWVHREKGTEVRSRIVAKGYNEVVNDLDDIYASTLIFCILRILLTLALAMRWTIKAGDVSTVFLHAALGGLAVYMWPPAEYYTHHNILWKLHKAMYGLRTSPKAWQEHLAQVLKDLGLQRLVSEPNVYKNILGTLYVMAYVDDLLFFGEDTEVTRVFKAIQAQVLLRPTGELLIGHTISFLGRQLTNKGEYIEITLGDKYMNNLLEEQDMHNSRPVNTPGTAALKTTTDDTALTPEEHKQYRRAVGKLQWMTYTRPDICYATKELARDLTAPTANSQLKLKHLLRYLQGTRSLNYIVRPASMPTLKEIQIDVYTDADWAGCPATRKSTTGFVIQVAGNTVHFGSRTQSVVALSSAESELYAIGTGATEALHVKNFLQEAQATSRSQQGFTRTARPASRSRQGSAAARKQST